jgi:hypothetical protein
MTLEEKIQDKTIIYQVKYDRKIALELAKLHLMDGGRKNCKIKILDACSRAIEWLKEAKVPVPGYIEKLSCYGQLEELNKLLAKAQVKAV